MEHKSRVFVPAFWEYPEHRLIVVIMAVDSAFQIIEAIAVTFAVAFAVVEWRQHTRRQDREAALELLHSFQTPDFAKALLLIYALPEETLSKKQI